jgi:hypothetical protein
MQLWWKWPLDVASFGGKLFVQKMARSIVLKRNFKNIKINKTKDPLQVNEIRDLVSVATAFYFLFFYGRFCRM